MDVMRWSEEHRPSGAVGELPLHAAPTIKNHSATQFQDLLICFGGYDGRRNHMTLLVYSLTEQRWIRPIFATHRNALEPAWGDRPSDNNNSNNLEESSSNDHHHHHHHHGSTTNTSSSTNNNSGTTNAHFQPIWVTGNPPPGRNGHSATLVVDPDDDDNGRIFIIGGWLGTGPLAAADLHVLDITHGGRTLTWRQPVVQGRHPGSCNMHTADYVPNQNAIYVFRGGNGREYLNDLHALDVSTLTWQRVVTTGAAPQQRANHASAVLEETAELFIFGGWYVCAHQQQQQYYKSTMLAWLEYLRRVVSFFLSCFVFSILTCFFFSNISTQERHGTLERHSHSGHQDEQLDVSACRWSLASSQGRHDLDGAPGPPLFVWRLRNLGQVLSRLANFGSTGNGLVGRHTVRRIIIGWQCRGRTGRLETSIRLWWIGRRVFLLVTLR